MKKAMAILAISAVIALNGCDSTTTTGGPGTAAPASERPMMGHTDDTFSLDVPMMAARVEQGEQESVSIGIDRGTNFAQDVSLRFSNVPPGVHIQPEAPVISRTAEEVELIIHATEEAAIGDFTVIISGHPQTGADATAELSLKISMRELEESDSAYQSEGAMVEREEHIVRMRAELDTMHARYEDLKVRASQATDDNREALNNDVAAAKVRLDEAEENLREARYATPDRWEKIKEGFKGASDELARMFD